MSPLHAAYRIASDDTPHSYAPAPLTVELRLPKKEIKYHAPQIHPPVPSMPQYQEQEPHLPAAYSTVPVLVRNKRVPAQINPQIQPCLHKPHLRKVNPCQSS